MFHLNHLVSGLVALAVGAIGICIYNVVFHPLRAIPGPPLARISRLWLFLVEMRGNPHFEILELHRKYGPMMRISPDEISFNGIEAFNDIYGQKSKFQKSEYFYRPFEDQAPNLFTIRNRQQHSQDKRLISYAFSRANIVQYSGSIYDKASYLMERIGELVKDGKQVPLFPAFRCMTLDTISDFAFGTSTAALKVETFESDVFEAIDRSTGSVPFFQHFPILREGLRLASRYNLGAIPNGFLQLGRMAEASFAKMHAMDTWTMFTNMIAAAEKQDTQLAKEHLVSEAIVMIVAGTDTTATSLAITLHHLVKLPAVYRKLQEEVQAIVPSLDSRPSVEELDTLPFLDACIKEGLRISSPSRTRQPRTVPEGGWTFKGHYFPAGKIVSSSPLYLLHNEAVFPSPTSYNPERWLVDEERKAKMLAYFQPFSRGTRQCIGQNLSLIEQKIVLSMLVRRFDPKEVAKENIITSEAITAVIHDPMHVRLGIASD